MLRVDPTNGENLLGIVILIAMQDAGGGRVFGLPKEEPPRDALLIVRAA
jgi:hypothetical protein